MPDYDSGKEHNQAGARDGHRGRAWIAVTEPRELCSNLLHFGEI